MSPRLRVGLLNTVPMSRIAPVLRALMHIEPAVRWSLIEGGVDDLESQLNAGRLDLLITNLLSGRGHYRQLALFADDLRLAVSAHSVLARRRSLGLEQLQDQPLIVRTHCEHLQHASRLLDRDKIRPAVVYRTRFDERALALVAGQLGACFIPDSFSMPAVRMVSVNGIDLPRTVGIQWASAAPQPIVASVLERFASSRRKASRSAGGQGLAKAPGTRSAHRLSSHVE